MNSEFVNVNESEYLERYQLAYQRIVSYIDENKNQYSAFFSFLGYQAEKLNNVLELRNSGALYKLSGDELKAINYDIYCDLLDNNYESSYYDPAYCAKCFGKSMGPVLSHISKIFYDLVVECYQGLKWKALLAFELVNYVYGIVNEEGAKSAAVKNAIYYYYHDYSYEFALIDSLRRKSPDYNEPIKVINKMLEGDNNYLYYYGSYISNNETQISEFLNGLSDEEINKLAETYVGGYVRGFKANGIDFATRNIVEIRYPIGYERIVAAAVKSFKDMGKRVVMYMDDHKRLGTSGTSPNRQFEYDHRNDVNALINKRYTDMRLEHLKEIYKLIKDDLSVFAGPACIETFGEKDFAPVNKPEALKPSDKNQQLAIKFKSASQTLIREFVDFNQVSFTIIAFPLPEIGDNFKEIFEATNMVNTLDNELYKGIQQAIIDELDTCTSCHIKGSGNNKTDLTVQLYKLNDPGKETIFENCVADVNIPVGEVFTSPVLKGTKGILNVSHAFLEGYEYKNLCITFEDGFIKEYSCDNFDNPEEGREYIKENILFKRETLPIGEFAIGTNTTAYKMGCDFNMWNKLPILIAEKTGPHFAVGDTCYSDMEDYMTYNPDGKAIVARDNEVTLKYRKTDREKAYFNCHTDITIPYDELAHIKGIKADGTESYIIKDGRFVLKGTEVLNEALN